MKIEIKEVANPGFTDLPDVLYSPVLDGQVQSCCAESEDIAHLLGMQIKYDGRNSQFAKMACRMLGIETKWTE